MSIGRLQDVAQRLDELSDDLGIPELMSLSDEIGKAVQDVEDKAPVITGATISTGSLSITNSGLSLGNLVTNPSMPQNMFRIVGSSI